MSAGSPFRSMRTTLRTHRGLVVILSLYLVSSLLYGVTIPIFETPDANGHYAYIHELTEGRGLPVQGTPSGARVTGYVASHPPVYYALCAALTSWVRDDVELSEWAWRNPYRALGDPTRTVNKNRFIHTAAERFPWRGTPLTMHISRFVSTMLGALAVVSTYGVALELFPDWRWLALGATALTAFNPMFVFTSARVSNDAAVTAFGSLAVWGAVRLTVRGLSRRGLALTGTVLGLAILSKLSGVILVPVVGLALAFDSLRVWRGQGEGETVSAVAPGDANHSRKGLRMPLRGRVGLVVGRWASTFLPALAVSGWWFARNHLLYDELMGVEAWLSHTATVRAEPIGLLDVIRELGGLERSYWAMFGWFNVAVDPWMYRFWWGLVRLAMVGLGLILLDQWTLRRFVSPVRDGLLVTALAFLLNLGSVWRFIMIVFGAQGRYLMPSVASISLLLMLGLSRLLPTRFSLDRWGPVLAGLLGAVHVGLTMLSLFAFILPAYARPEMVEEHDLPRDMARLNVSFEGTPVRLLGGHIEADALQPGGSVPVSLYWQATQAPQQDYMAFLQVLGRDMEPIAGVDCYPGRGNFPPTLWQPGVIYRDRYALSIAAGAEAPTAAALHAGLYDEEGEHVVGSLHGQLPLEIIPLDLVAVRPREPLSEAVGYPVLADLGTAITLVGYDLSAREVRPGDTITVTLVWRAQDPVETEYTAFVHLVDVDGELLAQSDHPPMEGDYPTSFWDAGDVVHDPHRLTVGETAASGGCSLAIGMYNSKTGERLPAYERQGGSRFQDDVIVGSRVAIE